MFFLPIGHERQVVQRIPIITISIISLGLPFLILTTIVIKAQEREIRELWEKKQEIELRYAMEQGDPRVLYDQKKYDRFIKRLREGTIVDKESEDYKTWQELDSQYAEKSASTIYHVLGFIPSKFYRLHTLFTCIFVHGGVMHYLGNMWFLWLLGVSIEDVWGRRNFLLFFFAAGVVASALHGLANFGSQVPSIGASGAIAGVMGAFMIREYKTKIRCFYFIPIFFLFRRGIGTFLLPAWVLLAFYFAFDLIYAFETFGHATGTAYWAHVGGFLAGVGTVMAFRLRGIEEKYITPRLEEKIEAVKMPPLMKAAFKEREDGNFEKAIDLLNQLVSQQPENTDAYMEMANIHMAFGRQEEAASAYSMVMSISLQKGEDTTALNTYYDMMAHNLPLRLQPDELYRLSGLLHKVQKDEDSVKTCQKIIKEFPQSTAAPKAIVRCATAFKKMKNYELAVSAYQHLLSNYPDLDWKDQIQSEIDNLKKRLASGEG